MVRDGKLSLTARTKGLDTVTVTATDYMGAKAESCFMLLFRDSEDAIDIYPNPVVDIMRIRTGPESEKAEVKINSASGQMVFSGTVECSAFMPGEVDMKAFAPGSYHVRVSLGGRVVEKTIMKI